MNDFTKEELVDIYYAVSEYGDFESINMKMLANKIQRMIENYCEHKNTNDGFGHKIMCLDCERALT